MLIRARTDSDLSALSGILKRVHALDGYPSLLGDDGRSFIVTTNCHAAWVAEDSGEIIGHVGLHTVWSDAVAELASAALACPRSGLAAVSRLFVSPEASGAGVGRALLETTTDEAHRRGLCPVLDVVTTLDKAVALYESAGWKRLGVISLEMVRGEPIDEFVYAAP